jgi:hypothetical protein
MADFKNLVCVAPRTSNKFLELFISLKISTQFSLLKTDRNRIRPENCIHEDIKFEECLLASSLTFNVRSLRIKAHSFT